MSSTMMTAGSETHVRIVAVALVMSTAFAWIGIVAFG